ncbi:MAG: DUF6489 family protein [Pseudomonadota bacterium]|nr:DUF6489 family protein [Pseudomonadota bacterium]
MNFRIDIEMTPEELRRTLGLPDVTGLQQQMVTRVREQMEAGAEGYDPLTLLKPYLNGGIGSMETFQKLLFNMLNQYGSGKRDTD